MQPKEFKGMNAILGPPEDWNLKRDGVCINLPIRREGLECVSCWELTDEERKAVANGGNIILRVFSGGTQPPVMLEVENPMSFGDDTLDPRNIEAAHGITEMKRALGLLQGYLKEFPEHDQADFRIWEASQILEKLLGMEKSNAPSNPTSV